MWHWYVAREDELMIDLDGEVLLEIARKRLDRSPLEWRSAFVAGSSTDNHFHLVIRLKEEMPALQRQVWQLFLMDHTYRSVNNLFRAIAGVPAPSLLIAPQRWNLQKFWRPADAMCHCKSHKNSEKIFDCPAHQKLRGSVRYNFLKRP